MIYCALHLGHLERKCPFASENTLSITKLHRGHLISRSVKSAASSSHKSSFFCISGRGRGTVVSLFALTAIHFYHLPLSYQSILPYPVLPEDRIFSTESA